MEVTVSAFTLTPAIQTESSAGVVRIYYTTSFDSDGVSVFGSSTFADTFYDDPAWAKDLDTGQITVESFVLISTENSTVPSAQAIGVLYDDQGTIISQNPVFVWVVPNSLGSVTTKINIDLWNNSFQPVPPLPAEYLNRSQVAAMIAQAVGEQEFASTGVAGKVFMSVTPVLADEPIAVGDNDPRLDGLPVVDASTTVKGISKLSVAPVSPTNPIAVGNNDNRLTKVFDPRNPTYGAVCDGVTNDTAAFQACAAALVANGGGTFIIPDSPTGSLLGGAAVANQILSFSVPAIVKGSGASRSVLLIKSDTPATTDVIRVTPTTTGTPEFGLNYPVIDCGYIFKDFYIRPVSGTPARDGIRIDNTAAGGFFSQNLIDGVFFGALGGRSISFLNNASNTDGVFANTVQRCYPSGGIYATNFGDSNRIINNRFWGDGNATNGRAIDIESFISGAGNLIIGKNNISQKGGVSINGGEGGLIVGNSIELYRSGSAGTNGAALSLDGGATNYLILSNIIASISGVTVDGVYQGTVTAIGSDKNWYKTAVGHYGQNVSANSTIPYFGPSEYVTGAGSARNVLTTSAQSDVFSISNGISTRVGSLNASGLGVTPAYTGYATDNLATLEINRNSATSNDSKWSTLNIVAAQSGISNVVGSVYVLNDVLTGEKRLSEFVTFTSGATNSGRVSMRTTNAGVEGERMSLEKDVVKVTSPLAQVEGAVLSVSSNTITPTHAIHHCGAGLIKTITVPSGFVSGTIALIPTAAFTYDATGNVLGTGTAVVGRTMFATYSSSTSKWSMSY